jgi:hypothetical protein
MRLKVSESYNMFGKHIFSYLKNTLIIKNFNLDFNLDCNNVIGFTSYDIIYEFINTYNYVFIFKNINNSPELNKVPNIEFDIPELIITNFNSYEIIDCYEKYLIINKTAYNYNRIINEINKWFVMINKQ